MRFASRTIIRTMVAVLLVTGMGGVVAAQTAAAVSVSRDVLAAAVVDKEPTPAPSPVPTDVGRLCYFTEVSAQSPTTIQHAWIWGDREMAVVTLQVSGSRYRTWSCKNIMPEWTGSWKVEVRSADGMVLASKEFTVGQ